MNALQDEEVAEVCDFSNLTVFSDLVVYLVI